MKCSFLIFLVFPLLFSCAAKKGASDPRKAEKIHARHEKEAQRKYEQDVKRHMNNQSKETKAMMKKAKKNAKKNSPVKPSSGKKCK